LSDLSRAAPGTTTPRIRCSDPRSSGSSIVGEALNKLRRADETLAAQIPDLPRIVAFRNLLIHGYATVDDRLVWEVATNRAAPLASVLEDMLESGS
jgi:uncharacterized protein with HEPN domain